MSKHAVHFIQGMGSVLDLAPRSDRAVTKPLFNRRGETPESALYRTWRNVGNSLIAASGSYLTGEGAPPKSAGQRTG